MLDKPHFLYKKTDQTKKLISKILSCIRKGKTKHTDIADGVAGQVLSPKFQKH